ncbi:MAG: hypothetical protein AB7G11_05470 [Phycisphaerales bacterium]
MRVQIHLASLGPDAARSRNQPVTRPKPRRGAVAAEVPVHVAVGLADYNRDGTVTSQDFVDFLASFFKG